MRFSRQKIVNLRYVRYFVLFLAPFLARPSDFSGRHTHAVYGLMKTIPFVPIAPAALFASAYVTLTWEIVENIDWSGIDHTTAIECTRFMVSQAKWASYVSIFAFTYLISGIRWTWYIVMRYFTNLIRRDNLKTANVPWRFFIFHTSGLAMWLGVLMQGFAYILAQDFKHPFSTIQAYLNTHPLTWLLSSMAVIGLLQIVAWNSKRIKEEIYLTKSMRFFVTSCSVLAWVMAFAADLAMMHYRI